MSNAALAMGATDHFAACCCRRRDVSTLGIAFGSVRLWGGALLLCGLGRCCRLICFLLRPSWRRRLFIAYCICLRYVLNPLVLVVNLRMSCVLIRFSCICLGCDLLFFHIAFLSVVFFFGFVLFVSWARCLC